MMTMESSDSAATEGPTEYFEIEANGHSGMGEEVRSSGIVYELTAACTGAGRASLRALVVVFVLTSTFTAAQFVGAYLANSLSLFGDCFTMAVDSVTYLLNIYAESGKGRRASKSLSERERLAEEIRVERTDIRVAFVSAIALVAVTIYITIDAVMRLHSEAGVDPVNAQIMNAFAAANLVMNFLSCLAFHAKAPPLSGSGGAEYHGVDISLQQSLSRQNSLGAAPEESNHERPGQDAETDPNGNDHSATTFLSAESEGGRSRGSSILSQDTTGTAGGIVDNLNLFSAFVHLAADTFRSITVFITSLVVWSAHGDAVRADAISSLLVCALIFVAAFYLLYETLKRVQALRALERLATPMPSPPSSARSQPSS